MRTSRSAFAYGNGRTRIALTTVKIAPLAPIPRPSVAIAMAVNPGAFMNPRQANRTSCSSVWIMDAAKSQSLRQTFRPFCEDFRESGFHSVDSAPIPGPSLCGTGQPEKRVAK